VQGACPSHLRFLALHASHASVCFNTVFTNTFICFPFAIVVVDSRGREREGWEGSRGKERDVLVELIGMERVVELEGRGRGK
jgi:hypothetical protein